jgi:hypothetical protein
MRATLAGLGTAVRRIRSTAILAAVLVGLAIEVTRAGATPPGKPPKLVAAPQKATFGIGPADAKGLDGRGVLNYNSSPGGHISDRVAVRNYGASAISLQIYVADATASRNGAIGYQPKSDPGADSNRWFAFSGNRTTLTVRLAPRAMQVLPLTIVVPNNASPGDHMAGVIASLTSHVVGKLGKHINLEQRVAVRALFRISGGIHSQLAIEHLRANYHDNFNPFGSGRATVTYTVRNVGNVNLGGAQRISLNGLFGSSGSAAKLATVPLLLPGASYPMRVEVHGIWPQLLMHARVTVTPIAVTGAVDPGLTSASASVGFWAVPWTLFALIVAVAALAVLGFLWRRRLNARSASHSTGRKTRPALGEA